MTELTAEQIAIRDGFVRRRGYWSPDWQIVLELHPEFMSAYTELSSYAVEHGTLDLKLRELIYVATCASVTHIHPPGILQHGRNALAAGATPQQLLAVLELVSTLGIATVQLAVSALDEVAPGTVDRLASANGSTPKKVDALMKRFEDVFRAPGDAEVEATIRAVPDFYSALLDEAAIPRLSPNVLTPREVALISLSVNALVTHLDRVALRRDIVAALAAGATVEEVLDVCMQIAGIGVHAITIGVPLLRDLIAENTP